MDLSIQYLGLTLRSPLIVGSGPFDGTVVARECQEAGAGMIVMHSLFEEQYDSERAAHHWSMEHGAGPDELENLMTLDPEEADHYLLRPEEYYERIASLKQILQIPVCGSINGTTPGNWVLYAQEMEEAGADAIELNLYDPVMDPDVTGEQIEARLLEVVQLVRRAVGVPLAVKLSPYYTSVAHLSRKLDNAGVDAIVLFNRFYQPDFDISGADLRVARSLRFSTSDELPLRLRWTAALFGKLRANIGVTGGVHTGLDAVKAILAGASAVHSVSALMKHGPGHLTTMTNELTEWLKSRGIGTVAEIQGALSLDRVPNRDAFDRANYVRLLREQALARQM